MQEIPMEKSYHYFKKMVLREIRYKVEGQVALQTIIKNNGLKLDGLTILAAGVNISPTIYLNCYYDKFLQYGLDAVVKEILEVYEQNKPNASIDITFFTDAEKVRSKIKMKLVNYERNKELLEKIPHIKFLDLAIIFYVEVENNSNGLATILIYHHHMGYWNFTVEEMFKLANENMSEDFKIVPMMDIINDIMSEECTEVFLSEAKVEMSIITNHSQLHGAIGMLQTNMLKEYMRRHHAERLIIIPSSVHEVLLIPCDPETDVASFNEMVQEVNATQLLPEEVLSDNAYIYDGSTIKIIE